MHFVGSNVHFKLQNKCVFGGELDCLFSVILLINLPLRKLLVSSEVI